jgi:putative transposase
MNREEREKRGQQIAEFRYGLIAELANPYLKPEELRLLLREKASREHDVPNLGRRKLTASCLRKWLAIYRNRGKEGLIPKSRRDAGFTRALLPAESALLLGYLEAHPQLTAQTALRTLQAEGRITGNLSTSSLSRLVRSAGLEKSARLKVEQQEKNLKFQFFSPLECVQADCMYSLRLPDAKGKLRPAVLLAFLDDATRRVLYAAFSFSESSAAFEAGLKHILMAHGRIGRAYVDNGGGFISSQTQRILDTLGVILIHSRPYKPAGRGKIERFWRTARQQFFGPLDPDSIKSLEDLDLRFHRWVESEYHRNPHRGLDGKTPLEAWLEKAHTIVPVDPTVDLTEVFLHEASRKVHKDSTITLDGVLYEVASTLIAERITVRYDPSVPPSRRRLMVFHGAKPSGEARMVDAYANTRVRRGSMFKDLIVDSPDEPPPAMALPLRPSPPSPTPLSASLSASRLQIDSEKKDRT